MHVLIFLLSLFLSLFTLYILSKNDFVLLRKKVSLVNVFDSLAITFISSFIVGRAVYVIESSRYDFINILKFLHFIKFPGISLFGIFLGACLALFFLFRKKEVVYRITDIISLSFYYVFLAFIILHSGNSKYLVWGKSLVVIILLFIFYFLIRFHKNYVLKDGSIALIIGILISGFSLAGVLLNSKSMNITSVPSLLYIFSLILFSIWLYINQNVFKNSKK